MTNIYPTPWAPASGVFVEQQIEGLRKVGLDVDLIFVKRAQSGMSAYLGLGRQIRSKIAGFQPDLVHVMYGGVMAEVVTHVVDRVPTVVSFCGSDLLGQPLSNTVRRLIARCGVLASWRAARRACGIVTKAKNLCNALPEDVDRAKVRIIPNGVDLERFKPLDRHACRARLGWAEDAFHVLFPTNSGDPCKRPDLACASIDALSRLGVTVDMHELRGVLHKEVPVWLNASNAVLLTSRHEGSPNIIKEALACNLPVVSVDVGDVRDRVQEIEGCYLALPEPHDLATKLYMVYAGSGRSSGREKMQELSLERIALRLKRFYKEVLLSWQQKKQPHLRGSERHSSL